MRGADDRSPRVRNGLGTVTFATVVSGALLTLFPATAVLGFLVCLLMIVPAIIAFIRTRRGVATNHRSTGAALVMAPLFLVVAVVVIGTAGVVEPPTVAGDTAAVGDARGLSAQPLSSGPAEVAAPAAATPAPIPTTRTAPTAGAAGTPSSTRAISPAAASRSPGRTVVAAAPAPAAVTRSPVRVDAPPASAQRPARASVPTSTATSTPTPTKRAAPTSTSTKKPSSTCDSSTHYVNDDGNCVLRPAAAATAPSGASATCKDGTLSFSQHRSGTCSRHGGVQDWLAGAPNS